MYNKTGDIMKKYLKIIIGAVLVGSIFAYVFYRDIKKEVNAVMNTVNKIYLFQVGVFKNEKNASNFQNDFKSSIVYYDNEYYRVLIAATTSNENKEKLINLFTNQSIKYFIKEMNCKEELQSKLINYEAVLNETDSRQVIDNINQSMLDIFLTYITNNKE